MPKGKALLLCILCAVSGVICYTNNTTTPIWAFMVVAALFLSVWAYKFFRDRSIVMQARLEREQAPQTSSLIPSMTSKGSRRLFVPQPLEK
jgi:hypothetical protein